MSKLKRTALTKKEILDEIRSKVILERLAEIERKVITSQVSSRLNMSSGTDNETVRNLQDEKDVLLGLLNEVYARK